MYEDDTGIKNKSSDNIDKDDDDIGVKDDKFKDEDGNGDDKHDQMTTGAKTDTTTTTWP